MTNLMQNCHRDFATFNFFMQNIEPKFYHSLIKAAELLFRWKINSTTISTTNIQCGWKIRNFVTSNIF